MKSDVLQAALCGYHSDAGLYLEEPDDHTLQLKRGDEVLATWYAPAAIIDDIRHAADPVCLGGDLCPHLSIVYSKRLLNS